MALYSELPGMDRVADVRILQSQPLLTPAALAAELPMTGQSEALIAHARTAAEDCLSGADSRLMVVVGPCSIHDPAAALDYAAQLYEQTRDFQQQLHIVLRVYFEKPRTVIGWKGLINDPNLDSSYRLNHGLHLARKLLLDVAELGLPAATEFLDNTFGQYYAELISFGAIGARTVESQIHRQLASGLSMPVGIKNRTDGDIGVAIDAIRSAAHPHWFPSLTHEGEPAALQSSGNEHCYLILRGGDRSGPNYSAEAVEAALAMLRDAALPPGLVIDCSHGNSAKQPEKQADVVSSIVQQMEAGQRGIRGVMLESHLRDGRQDVGDAALEYGMSITDACLSLERTLPLLAQLANAVARTQ
ncbi:MAG: 3-deoxy-7-phosphoheptulonate synthase AroG [Halioglobus sp.]